MVCEYILYIYISAVKVNALPQMNLTALNVLTRNCLAVPVRAHTSLSLVCVISVQRAHTLHSLSLCQLGSACRTHFTSLSLCQLGSARAHTSLSLSVSARFSARTHFTLSLCVSSVQRAHTLHSLCLCQLGSAEKQRFQLNTDIMLLL